MISRDNFCKFCIKPYVVTRHLNRINETAQMRGHNMVLMKIKKKLSSNLSLEFWALLFKTNDVFS